MLRLAARPTIAVLLLTTQLVGCTEWRAQTMSARDLIESSHPGRLRVTRTDSTSVVLDQPALLGDTLVGQVKGSRSAVAVADVASVAVRRTNTVNTVLLIGGILGLTAAAAAAGSSGYGGSISLSGF
jgi:hypothetical protein